MTTSLYTPVASPGDVSAKNYTSLYSDSLTPGPNPSGDVTIQGNLTVRGGNIYTTATTASVFPHNATTVNAFTAATTLNLAGDTGYTTINNQLNIGGKAVTLMANTTGPLPLGDEYGLVVKRDGSLETACLIWVETGNLSTSYWSISADARILGDASIQNNLFVDGDSIVGNAANTNPAANFSLVARRGLPTYNDVAIIWNGAASKWQFTNDGTTFYDFVTSGSGGSATFGNINIAVADANTISTNSGPLKLASSTNAIDASTADLTAANLFANNSIISSGVLGTNNNFVVVNYDDNTLTGNAGFVVRRGASADVALRWNYTTNKWQFSNDGTTYYDMVSSLDTLSDVVITGPVNAQFLVYDGTNWINSNTTTATSASQTLQLKRSGAFSGDLPDTPKSALRLIKKFTDVATAPYDKGGPGITLNVEDSTGTQYSFAAITSNYDSGGDNAIALISSSDGFTSLHENAVFGALTSTINSDPTVNGDLQVNGTGNFNGSVTVASGNLNVTSGNIIATSATASLSSINLDSRVIKNTATQTYTTTSQQVFGNIPIATYRTVKYTWQISRGTEFQALETLVTHNGTTAYITTYADIRTGANLANFDVDISGSNMRILVTPTSAASTVLVCDYTLFNV
jgi:hypothetical protein